MLPRIIEALIALAAVALALEIGVTMMRAMQHRNDPDAHKSARRAARTWTYGITVVVLVAFVGLAIGWSLWPLTAVLIAAVLLGLAVARRRSLE